MKIQHYGKHIMSRRKYVRQGLTRLKNKQEDGRMCIAYQSIKKGE